MITFSYLVIFRLFLAWIQNTSTESVNMVTFDTNIWKCFRYIDTLVLDSLGLYTLKPNSSRFGKTRLKTHIKLIILEWSLKTQKTDARKKQLVAEHVHECLFLTDYINE